MKGRALWGFALPTLAVALLALALLVSGAAGGSGHGKHRGGGPGEIAKGQPGYHFLVFDAVSGASDRMIITGDGSFNGNQAHGGGTFDHFQTGTTLPLHIVASEDLGWIVSLLGPLAVAAGRRRRLELGLDDDLCRRGTDAIRAVLAAAHGSAAVSGSVTAEASA